MSKNKLKFILFLGVFFFMYLILYFPDNNEEIVFSKILFDVFRALIMGFVIIYVSDWFRRFIDAKKLK